MSYLPATDADRAAMLEAIGVASIDELFSAIPSALRLGSWNLPEARSEMAVQRHMADLAGRNYADRVCFMGGGVYDHHIPAAIDSLSGRSEFLTAYTPYQPECSQGTLQAIFEYQTAVCRLMGLEVANASLYDGGTAVFEAMTMALRATGRSKVVCHGSLNPVYRKILATHAENLGVAWADGDDPSDAACVIVQNPSFLGDAADFTALAAQCHAAGALLVMSCYPLSLGLLKSPGEMGADIAVGEGQSLGLPMGFGGPYLGMLATKRAYMRKMPGRLVAATQDAQGRRGFVLTLQSREQHIRREKAMSNICSNEAWCALRALMYLCLMGDEGLRGVAEQCHAKAEYLKGKLGFAKILNPGATFNEFAIRLPRPADVCVKAMASRGYLAGVPLEPLGAGGPNDLLIAVTEKRTRAELDGYATALEDVACN